MFHAFLTRLTGLPVICCIAAAAHAQTAEPSVDIEGLSKKLEDAAIAAAGSEFEETNSELFEIGRRVAMGDAQNGGADMACMSCHGLNGQGDRAGVFPRLAGQPAWYGYKQLSDYASGARANQIMTGVATRLTEKEKAAASIYYSAIDAPTSPALGDPPNSLLEWGAELAAVGSAEKGIPACTNCHGPEGTGLSPSVPYLSGQHAGYMENQLNLWKDDIRRNDINGIMSAITDKMTERDIRAVSQYYGQARAVASGQSAQE